MLGLEDVVLVAVTAHVPDVAPHWPVRIVRAKDVPRGARNAYVCGVADSVEPFLRCSEEPPLGLIIDSLSFTTPISVELLPALHDGFSMRVWEKLVSMVCSHHLDTVQGMILSRAKCTPDKAMLVYKDNEWSFQQCLSMANSLTDQLAARGFTRDGGPLAVQLPTSDLISITYLGLFAAGYVAHVVDAHPASRSYKLSVCKSQALLCTSAAEPEGSLPMVLVDKFVLDTTRPVKDFQSKGRLEDVAFIEYTSGSTGRPKSVASLNWRLANVVRWREFHFPLADGNERVAANLFHVWYWHLVPGCGGTCVIYPTELNHDVTELIRYVERHKCTKIESITPGLIQAILNLELVLPETLKVVVSGGEALPMATCQEWLRRFPQIAFWNNLATTETAADVGFCRITSDMLDDDMPFAPVIDDITIWNSTVEVVEEQIVITGWCVADGYLPPTVSDKYTCSPDGKRNRYMTGDRGKWVNGKLYILGRADSTVKVRGFRVDLAGLDSVIGKCAAAKDAVFVDFRDAVWCVLVTDDLEAVKRFAIENMEHNHLIVWHAIDKLPYTGSGKRDRVRIKQMLEERVSVSMDEYGGPPVGEGERRVAAAWTKILGHAVGREEPWTQAGGNSLSAMRLAKDLGLQPAEVYACPTVAAMAAHIERLSAPAAERSACKAPTPRENPQSSEGNDKRIAIVGISCRLPGASSIRSFWEALKAGRDLISSVPSAGSDHIPRKGIVPDEGLDCGFWGIRKEAAVGMDTAQRVLLEVAYEALEDAGFDPLNVPGRVGVVVCGGTLSHYSSEVLGVDLDECRTERPDEYFGLEIGTDKDYLATTVAYQLNLHGPAESVQTACSSSLVAVVRAVHLLRLNICDYVVCGGVSFSPDGAVRKVDGMIWSPDGICRPFADNANGTVNSDGCGLVVLTQLDAALRRGDWIYATILGVASNNDGARKAGFSAPSHEGQVEVIQMAMADAGVTGDNIDYVEAHGTGTKLGDPIELHALTEALQTNREVLLGSVKGNIGHLNTAAGIPGLIKVAEMMWRREMLPSLHADRPTSLVDWERTPLRLAEKGGPWEGQVAGLSSFGIGGTNVHIIVGASPVQNENKQPPRTAHLYVSSAKTVGALRAWSERLVEAAPDVHPTRMEATLLRRRRFAHCCFALRIEDLPRAPVVSSQRPVVLLFPGPDAAYAGMGSELAKEGFVSCNWNGIAPVDVVKASLMVAAALKQQGLAVEAVLGHSVGEWAAAAFAGAVPAADAIHMADLLGKLVTKMESSTALTVHATSAQIEGVVRPGVEVSCLQGAETLVLAGPQSAMAEVQAELGRRGLAWTECSGPALHAAGVDCVLPEYLKALEKVSFGAAAIPLLSNVSGDWHEPGAMSAQYWARHLREPVRFLDNLRNLAKQYPSCMIVEVGPTALAGLVAREAAGLGADWLVSPTMREGSEVEMYLTSLGHLWTTTKIQPRLPVGKTAICPLPTYSFQRDALVMADKNKSKLPRVGKSTRPNKVASKALLDGVQTLFYETCYEHVEISCLDFTEATVVKDGDSLPHGLPANLVVATAARAVLSARSSKCLFFVGSSDTVPPVDDTSQEELVEGIVRLIKELVNAKAEIELFFILKKNVRYAGLWGLLRSASREHPELRMRRLLWEEGAPLLFPAMPVELLLKHDGAYAPRLRPATVPPAPRSSATYSCGLVTGGLRGIGVKVAEWLVATKRVAALVVVGRNPPQGEAAESLRKLKHMVPVEICICDVARWSDVQKLPDCDLVIHAAGNVKDGLLVHTPVRDMRQVLQPKVQGAVHLKERYPNARLLGFSSSSGVFGSAAQATYAFANTFLDAIMPSIQWGGWAGTGMAKDLGIVPMPGERFLPVSVGLECLGTVLDGPEQDGPFCVLDCDWAAFRQNPTQFWPQDPLLADIEAERAPSLIGSPSSIGDQVHCWEMAVGPAGARHEGTHPAWEVCQQHVIGQAPVFPATAFVAMALEAASRAGVPAPVRLTDVVFHRPMEIATPRHIVTILVQNGEASGGGGSIRFTSQQSEDEGPVTLYCTCNFGPAPRHPTQPFGIGGASLAPVEGLYASFNAAGFHYGPAFRTYEARCDGTHASCRLRGPSGTPFQVHPAILDAAMHLTSLLHPLGCRGVPQVVRRITVHTTAALTSAQARVDGTDTSIHLLDEAGAVACAVEGLELAALDAPPKLELCQRVWQELPAEPRGTWLLRGEEVAPLGLPQTTSCEEDSHEAEVFAVRAEAIQDVLECRRRAQEIVARSPCWVVAVEAPLAEAAAAAAAEVGAQVVVGTAESLRELSAGLGVRAKIVRARDGRLFAEVQQPAAVAEAEPAPADEPFVVAVDPAQGTKGAKCYASQRRPPKAGEVEVKTSIWALNFRDVLVAVGAIPTEVAGQSLGIGGECYGEVIDVGADVADIAVGDKVVAVPPDGMGSHVTVDTRWVMRASAASPEEAVAGTMAYATAWLGIHWMARVAKGDAVLIHSAAGGVGLAAVHLCLRAGCTVYATASTEEKRSFLLSLGVTGAFDSRNPESFGKGVLAATDGDGVDVVLNSLSGDAITTSLRILRPFGRFIEIGKRDQYEDTSMKLGPFLGGLTYAAAHLDVLMLRQPKRCRQLLEEVWNELPALPGLPTKCFDMAELAQALEYFSKGVHIGKVLVSIGDTPPTLPARPAAVAGPPLDAVSQDFRHMLGARAGRGGIVCVPGLDDLPALEADLRSARVAVTASRAVAAAARALCPAALCVELPSWGPIKSLDDWLHLRGHFVAVEKEKDGDFRQWLMEVVWEMAGSIEMDQTFEDAGLDSLSLISLARRMSTKIGRSVSVLDLYDHPTPQRLLQSFVGAPQQQLARPKILCLHGFRSNREAFQVSLAPYVSAVGGYEWLFVNSPRRASGPSAPGISAGDAFEWWGQKGGPYETGWLAPHYDGLEETLEMARGLEPAGIVGFSQGGGLAALIDCTWLALFSPVVPRGLRERTTPSFHAWDPHEEYVGQCAEVAGRFTRREVHEHSQGHAVPQGEGFLKQFVAFVARSGAD